MLQLATRGRGHTSKPHLQSAVARENDVRLVRRFVDGHALVVVEH